MCRRVYWGWIVCLSFLVLFTVAAGIAFSFGEIIIPISNEVNTSMPLLTWAGALPGSIPMLAAPLTTCLQHHVTTRLVVIVGVMMTSLSLLLMSIVRDIMSILFVYGVLCGVGMLLIVNPPFFLIDSYFPYEHPRHVLATSIVACAFPLATLLFNPVTYCLISFVGWRMTYAVYSVLMFVVGVTACSTFRPPKQDELSEELCRSRASPPNYVTPPIPKPATVTSLGNNSARTKLPLVKSHIEGNCEEINEPMRKTSVFFAGIREPRLIAQIQNCAQSKSDNQELRNKVGLILSDYKTTSLIHQLPEREESQPEPKESQLLLQQRQSEPEESQPLLQQCQSEPEESQPLLQQRHGPASAVAASPITSLRTKVILGFIWFLASIFKSIGYYTPLLILVKQMDQMGIPQWQSSRAVALSGSCEVISRLVTSYLGDKIKGRILTMYVVCTLTLCVQNAVGSLATTYTHLCVYAAALGIFGGPVIAAMYASCLEVMDRQHVPALFSTFRAGLGLGALIGPTMAGVVYDFTGSFRGCFYVNCATYAMTSLLYSLIILINRRLTLFSCFRTENLSHHIDT